MALLAPGSAAAQRGDPGSPRRTPLIESLSGPAKEAYQAALTLENNKDCAHANAKFAQAYALSNDARLLFDMAICYRDLRAYAQMEALLLRYEREAGKELSPEEKDEVEAALDAIRRLVGTVELTVNEANADVHVDGEPAGRTPLAAPLVVDLGKHTLTIEKDGFEREERVLDVVGGNATSLSIALVAQPHPALLHVVSDVDATIVIDHKDLAHGSFDGALAPGVHHVEVTQPGKKAYQLRLVLGDGEVRSLQIQLEDRARPSLWPWLVGAGAAVVGGGIGTYFLLRPQEAHASGPQGQLFTYTLPPGAH